MNYIIIGDVHGCLDELIEMVDTYGKDRKIVFVGDLIDKGPRPHRCLELAKLLGADVVLGNHEENHTRYAKHETNRLRTGKKNPMKRDDEFKETHRKIVSSSCNLIDYMRTFPAYIRIPEYEVVVVHGGLLPGVLPEDMNVKKICRVRNVHPDGKFANLDEVRKNPSLPFWTELYTGHEHVVYGHAPISACRTDTNRQGYTCYGIDTSCVYGGKLSALLLPEFAVVSVRARKTYYVQKW